MDHSRELTLLEALVLLEEWYKPSQPVFVGQSEHLLKATVRILACQPDCPTHIQYLDMIHFLLDQEHRQDLLANVSVMLTEEDWYMFYQSVNYAALRLVEFLQNSNIKSIRVS